MERGVVTGKRGQISIEFLFIFMIALVYISSVIQPGMRTGEAALDDVTRVSQARAGAETIALGITELALLDGQAKKTIRVFVPENTQISCSISPASVRFTVHLNPELVSVSSCPNRTCTGTISVAGILSCPGTGFSGKAMHTIQLTKSASGVVNVQ